MKNRKDISELRKWEIIKTAKKTEEFKIKKKIFKMEFVKSNN